MSIRPSYRRRSVVQVLADGMNAHPPTGRSCCEEAQLNANEVKAKHDLWLAEFKRAEHTLSELARRNEELAEAEGEIAALTIRAERAEAERDEVRAEIERLGEVETERDELQAKLDAAENRPTLDRDTVLSVIQDSWEENGRGELDVFNEEAAADAIMQLSPAAEGWPDWMGPRVDPDDFEMRRTEKGRVVGEDGRIFAFEGVTAEVIRDQVHSAVEYAAQLKAAERFIESEQAVTGDEDQRIEEQAKALYNLVGPSGMSWDEMSEGRRCDYRAAIRAGWTPPESEAGA